MQFKDKLKNFKMTKERWCTVAQIVYHIVFAGGMFGGGSYYLAEFQKTRDTIVQQVDRVETLAKQVEASVLLSAKAVDQTVASGTKAVKNSAKTIKNTGDKVDSSVDELRKALKKVEKVCRF